MFDTPDTPERVRALSSALWHTNEAAARRAAVEAALSVARLAGDVDTFRGLVDGIDTAADDEVAVRRRLMAEAMWSAVDEAAAEAWRAAIAAAHGALATAVLHAAAASAEAWASAEDDDDDDEWRDWRAVRDAAARRMMGRVIAPRL
jgi:hypothetical protein